MSDKVKELTDRVKWKDRSDLKLAEWRKDRYYLWDQFMDEIIEWDLKSTINKHIETIDYDNVSIE